MWREVCWAVILVSVVYGVVHIAVVPTFRPTLPISEQNFGAIKLDSAPVTNIVLVHGIGHHCIGYGDEIIQNLLKFLGADMVPVTLQNLYANAPMHKAFEFHVPRVAQGVQDEAKDADEESGRLQGSALPGQVFRADRSLAARRDAPVLTPDLDGGCLSRFGIDGGASASVVNFFGRSVSEKVDYELLTSAQDVLCETISGHGSEAVDCHLLHVRKLGPGLRPPQPYIPPAQYVTGFVRRVQGHNAADGRAVRIYELTWSPATRWVKKSLGMLERVNERFSGYLLNRRAKTRMTNAAFSDALAYLSDNGVLINYSIFQTLCLALSDSGKKDRSYEFTCPPEQLRRASQFAKENSIFLISHSLGTQALFDTLGMMTHELSRRYDAGIPVKNCGLRGYIGAVHAGLERIGAQMPGWVHHWCDFESLPVAVKQFTRSIKSIFALTNQLPLFAVRNTSPFRSRNYDIGTEFRGFLALRNDGELSMEPLEIVSFHDPDDVLSYNLDCWYRQSVVSNLRGTRDAIESSNRMSKADEERRRLRDVLFGECRSEGLDSADSDVFRKIEQEREAIGDVTVVDASLRLEGFRFRGLLADPVAVHSKYLTDPTVHSWLVAGH